jgi:hypothetical protein
MEWLGDRQGGNLGTDLLGEEDALLDGLGGEIRPVSRNQDVLEQNSALPSSFFLTRKIANNQYHPIALRSMAKQPTTV